MIARTTRWLVRRVPVVRALVKSGPAQRCIVAVRGSQTSAGPCASRSRRSSIPGLSPNADSEDREGSCALGTLARRRHPHRDLRPCHVRATAGNCGGTAKHEAAVLDLGGNVGLFGLFAFERLSAETVTSIEPDPGNADVLRRCIECNRLGGRWSLVRAAASTHNGLLRFRAGKFADSRIAEPGEEGTIEVPCVDAITMMAGVDLVKIDIQGGEWPLLHDPRARRGSARSSWSGATIGTNGERAMRRAYEPVTD